MLDLARRDLFSLRKRLGRLRLNIFKNGNSLQLKHVLDGQGVGIHIEVLEEGVLNKQVDCLNVLQGKDAKGDRWTLDRVPQQQVLKVLVHLVF